VLGLCGGYQMLGRHISDPYGIEGSPGTVEGLGLLNVETVLGGTKTLTHVTGRDLVHAEAIEGYEIHIGQTHGPDHARPMLEITNTSGQTSKDGARSVDGRVAGCYVHGLFSANGFRHRALAALGRDQEGTIDFQGEIDGVLDRLADHLENHLDIDGLFALAR
jgi:adenosylcobyric acid synthase